MNLVTFNEPLKLLCQSPQLRAKDFEAVCNSPLLVWEERSELDFNVNDFRDAFHIEDGSPRLPFSEFRMSGFYHYIGPGWQKFRAWIRQYDNPRKFRLVWMIEETDDSMGDAATRDFLFILDAMPKLNSVGPLPTWIMDSYRFNRVSGVIDPINNEVDPNHLRSLMLEPLNKLAIDFLNPHFYLCRKYPSPKGHSVVWQKAREHFVLLHKTHSANRSDHLGKKLVTDGPLIDRMAHSRRAHFRMLKSPKFKHKQGHKIWIQSAWIGPKEWTDRSGQIYQIVDKPKIVIPSNN